MKINELIKELRKFEREHGNLEVGIYKDDESGQYGEYFADIDVCIVRTKNNKLYEKLGEYNPVDVDEFCVIY